MQRFFFIPAYLFIVIDSFSQVAEPGGQYPFVYYTPKQGLVNSRVRSIKQDSRGRMLFITFGGLSIYDGARFINYTQQDGLANNLVNDVAEVAPDSFLVATNTQKLNVLTNGKVEVFKTDDGFCPVVNHFMKSSDGNLYIAADEGLFILKDRKFIHLPFTNNKGVDIGRNLEKIVEWNDYLLLMPWASAGERLIIYNKKQKKIVSVSLDNRIFDVIKTTDNQLWVSFREGLKILDTAAIRNGKINLLSPPPAYLPVAQLKNAGVLFDRNDNLYISVAGELKIFFPRSGEMISIGQNSSAFGLTNILQDREGTIWFATDGKGVIKMPGFHVQLMTRFSKGHPAFITAISQRHDTAWFFDARDHSIIRAVGNELRPLPLRIKTVIGSIYSIENNLYIVDDKKITRFTDKNNTGHYQQTGVVYSQPNNGLGLGLIDPHGAIIIHLVNDSGYYLMVLKKGKQLMKYRLGNTSDQIAIDMHGRLWVITRNNDLMVFGLHPENPSQYLQLLKNFSKEIPHFDPRAVTVDRDNNVWIGTRDAGVFCLKFDSLKFRSAIQVTTKNGLTDNFVYSLVCDNHNVVWIGTQTGLDKIVKKNGQLIIGNISKNYNFFQAIWRIVVTEDAVWGLTSEGTVLKVLNNSPALSSSSSPPLLLSWKINGQPENAPPQRLSFRQNNLTLNVAAPSFVDERSIMYSYVLKGSGNSAWSEPSNNSVFNFINLRPGKYELKIRSDFPELMYPSQFTNYPFEILSPWWQSWWFRIPAGLITVLLSTSAVRYYYRRKLEKQQMILEKQQAVEQERSRIAADMHDDLGAGLTKIKFITEDILEKTETGESALPELQKLRSYSSELVESMGEIIWAVSEKNNLLSSTLYYLRSYAVNYCEEHDLDCHFELPENFDNRVLSGNVRRNIFLLMKESLHNIVKHASAKNVTIAVKISERLELVIKDDGKGFSMNGNLPTGNGLINMKKRAGELNGDIRFDNDRGTIVTIQLPLPLTKVL